MGTSTGRGRVKNAREDGGAVSSAPRGDASNGRGENSGATNMELLRSMLLQRRFEERTAEAYAMGRIGGFCHLYIGQEAVSTGTISLLRDDDYVITTYRDHGQALARGMTPRRTKENCQGWVTTSQIVVASVAHSVWTRSISAARCRIWAEAVFAVIAFCTRDVTSWID